MSGHLPNGTHINPKFSGAHINPNFKGGSDKSQSQQQIYINPKFIPNEESKPQAKPQSKHVYINPKFANRALPPIPSSSSDSTKAHINPEFLDGKKAKAYEEAIKMAVESKIHVKPNVSPTSALEKENVRTPSHPIKTPSVFASAKKSLFKKIGNRKLVRVKSTSSNKSDQETPKFRTSLTKIGHRKLIKGKPQSPQKQSVKVVKKKKLSLEGTYRVKTSRKVVKNSSPIFVTPFTSRKRKASTPSSKSPMSRKRFALSRVLNPFKVDRRLSSSSVKKPMKRTVTPKKLGSGRNKKTSLNNSCSPSRVQKYAINNTPLMKKPAPPKPTRRTPAASSSKPSTTLINVQGVRFAVSDNGRKLKRLQQENSSNNEASSSKTEKLETSINANVPKKLFLEGEEYIEEEPGVLIRSRNSMTRQSITSYKQRSINTILKSQTRSKQYCMFFNKFGKCKKKEDGRCPYIHDPEKVAVCRKFLQGNCFKDQCLLSHKVAPEKMPVCKYYLEGVCAKDPCPYRHVKVNDSAEICPEFLKGFCPLYDKCLKRHEDTKKTPKTPHNPKKVPPAKPKRKSIGATPLPNLDKKKPRTRYFENDQEVLEEQKLEHEATKTPIATNTFDESFERKRQRLLRKVELAKQGWTGIGATVQDQGNAEETIEDKEDNDNLDDTPYEEIEDDYEENEAIPRPPLGPLPSFISLTNNAEEGNHTEQPEQEEYDERLI